MIHVKQTILVEGKYDKIRLSSCIDANIVVCHGFGIFRNKEKLDMLRRLAKADGLLILTDSDRAGFSIRSYVKGCIQEGKVYHAYIPDILGKERRKDKPSKEGLLGVEGMDEPVLMEALRRSGIFDDPAAPPRRRITVQDLYADGLSGGPNSHLLRKQLLRQCELPTRMSTREMVSTLNSLMTYEEYRASVDALLQSAEDM